MFMILVKLLSKVTIELRIDIGDCTEYADLEDERNSDVITMLVSPAARFVYIPTVRYTSFPWLVVKQFIYLFH